MEIVRISMEVAVVLLSLLLTLLILMHKGKGGGLSDMFGGGLTQNAGTSGPWVLPCWDCAHHRP